MTFQDYLAYWPAWVGALVFFALGLWMYLVSEAAMERSPKPVSWVGNYRKPCFPFHAERLPWEKPSWPVPALLTVLAAFVSCCQNLNAGMILIGSWTSCYSTAYNVFCALIDAGGALAVFFLLLLLFRSRFSALLGTLLFLAVPLSEHNAASMLAVGVLFLVLYLRSEGALFRTELWYLAACLFFGLSAAVSPVLLWLLPVCVVLHWYKLSWNLRHNRIGVGKLFLYSGAALVGWILFLVIAALMFRFMRSMFSFSHLAALLTPLRIRYACSELLASACSGILRPLLRSRVLEPMIDAPLFGLGFWGLFSAGGMALKRRRVQGWFVLGLTVALGLIWLLSGCYALSLPLALAAGSMAKNAELGGKRTALLVIVIIGVLFSLGMAVGAWALPMVSPLALRMI